MTYPSDGAGPAIAPGSGGLPARGPASGGLRPPYHPRTHTRRQRGAELLGLREASAMAIGGMIGGGIFSVLGVTVDLAGHLAFAAFLLGGLIAGLTARAYAGLALRAGRAGGPFTYLRDGGHSRPAAWVAWLLIVGYVFALAVYAFTFGHYLANVLGAPVLMARLAGIGVLALFVAINLRGVATSGRTEDVIVATKLAVLAGIALIGMSMFTPARLSPLDNQGLSGVFLGAAVIFVAYEGFELLPYDYDDIANPRRTLPRALYLSVATVMLVYLAVTIASQMLLPDQTIIDRKEVAFAVVGEKALGTFGLWRRPSGPSSPPARRSRHAVLKRTTHPRRQRSRRAPGPPGPRAARTPGRGGALDRHPRRSLLAAARHHRDRLLRLADLPAGLRTDQPPARPPHRSARPGPRTRLCRRRRLHRRRGRPPLLPGPLRPPRPGPDRRLRSGHHRGPSRLRQAPPRPTPHRSQTLNRGPQASVPAPTVPRVRTGRPLRGRTGRPPRGVESPRWRSSRVRPAAPATA